MVGLTGIILAALRYCRLGIADEHRAPCAMSPIDASNREDRHEPDLDHHRAAAAVRGPEGGYYGYRGGYYGGGGFGGVSLIVLIIVLVLLFGGGRFW
jgi:hypothetical protein